MKLIYLLIFSLFTNSNAGSNKDIQIQLNAPADSSQQLDLNYKEIPNEEFQKKSTTVLPNNDIREQAFQRAGLIEAIDSWGEVDRDLLYLRAQNRSYSEFIQYYPKINKEKLLKLQRWILSSKRSPSQSPKDPGLE
jgi:hypothetical protein